MIKSLYPFAQKWSEKGSVYLISDPHFDDADCWLMDPDWPGPNEYIANLKKKIHKNDTLVCLGDCGDPKYFKELNCYKVLIKGNHDKGNANYSMIFDEIYEGPLFISEKLLLSHEPILGGDAFFNIHGHTHDDNYIENYNELDITSNHVNYEPISLGDLIKDGILSRVCGKHRLTIEKRS